MTCVVVKVQTGATQSEQHGCIQYGNMIRLDHLCGLVVSVEALLRIFLRELSLERGPLSLVIG
jgi:hypothetical protein